LEWCSYALDSETLPLCLRSIPRNPRRPISWRARPWARGGQCREVAFNGDGRGLDQPPGGGTVLSGAQVRGERLRGLYDLAHFHGVQVFGPLRGHHLIR
jgi:hypothetical protein